MLFYFFKYSKTTILLFRILRFPAFYFFCPGPDETPVLRVIHPAIYHTIFKVFPDLTTVLERKFNLKINFYVQLQ